MVPQAISGVQGRTSSDVIIAYRAWKVGPKGWLLPMGVNGHQYEPRKRIEAHCIPQTDDYMGIHGFKTVKDIVENYGSDILETAVLGRVALWGVVQCHKHGYRSQYAYPQLFFNIDGLRNNDKLANQWGIETSPLPSELQHYAARLIDRKMLAVFHYRWDNHIERASGIPILDREAIVAKENNRREFERHATGVSGGSFSYMTSTNPLRGTWSGV